MIIGVGHTRQVGKDSIASILVSAYGFTRASFADVLRAVAYDSNPMIRRLVDIEGWDAAKEAHKPVRAYLDDLGRACRRHIDDDVWINAVFNHLAPAGRYIITDVRYPNEHQRVLDHGGITVLVTRPDTVPANTGSDRALAGFTGWTTEIDNDGSLNDLVDKVDHLMESVGLAA